MNRKNRASEHGKDYRILVLLVIGLSFCIFRLSREGQGSVKNETCPTPEMYLWLESSQLPSGLYRFPAPLTWPALYARSGIAPPPGNGEALPAPAHLSTIHFAEHAGPIVSGPHPSLTPFFFLPVPLNLAEAELIATLPDIGLLLAERIVAYRLRFGSFDTLEDLLKVDGIGPGKIAKMRPFVAL